MFNVNKKKESEIEESDSFVRCKPGGLNKLCKITKFTRGEIRILYQGFKQECPSGLVSEEAFKDIFAHYFPQGDSSHYAHYVFKTFEGINGQKKRLNFEDFLCMLSNLSRGTTVDKIRWIFNLYDIDGDGSITKQELLAIVKSIYNLLGNLTKPLVEGTTPYDHVEKIFYQMDANRDGIITFDEFCSWCQEDDDRAHSLLMLDTIFM